MRRIFRLAATSPDVIPVIRHSKRGLNLSSFMILSRASLYARIPPWRNRHYFPRTGKRPRIGRLEILPKHRISKPEEYFRFWSASSFPPASPGRYAAPPDYDSEQQ